jgi:hypothetical protein
VNLGLSVLETQYPAHPLCTGQGAPQAVIPVPDTGHYTIVAQAVNRQNQQTPNKITFTCQMQGKLGTTCDELAHLPAWWHKARPSYLQAALPQQADQDTFAVYVRLKRSTMHLRVAKPVDCHSVTPKCYCELYFSEAESLLCALHWPDLLFRRVLIACIVCFSYWSRVDPSVQASALTRHPPISIYCPKKSYHGVCFRHADGSRCCACPIHWQQAEQPCSA